MRKITAIFLVFVLVFGLFGCQKAPQQASSCSVPEMLIAQAASMAQQIGMSASPAYLGAMNTTADVTAQAAIFQAAATQEPTGAKSFSIDQRNFSAKVLELLRKFASSSQLALCGTLAYSQQISLPKTLEITTVVIVEYSARCNIIVVFQPLENGRVSAWAYPLVPGVSERVLEIYGQHAEEWGGSQVQECCEAAADVDFYAEPTGKAIDADYYAALATSVFANVKPVSANQVSQYTTSASIVEQVVSISKNLTDGILSTQVYKIPVSAQEQIDNILAKAGNEQLEELTAQRVYLALPSQMITAHGSKWLSISNILGNLLHLNLLGVTAVENEEPVLVLLELSGDFTVVMCIYPSAYNTYLYSFAVLPAAFSDAQARMEKAGATMMQ